MTRDWIQAAKELPIAFARVREDALQDQLVLRRLHAELGRPLRVLMIGSGGCTAALLACEGTEVVEALTLADANPAQLELVRLKLALLAHPQASRDLALGVEGDEAERWAFLESLASEASADLAALGPKSALARGLDRCGRYEATFEALRSHLAADEAIERFLETPSARTELLESLRPKLEAAFEEVFALGGLIELFGEGATANRVQPFSSHFHERTLGALESTLLPPEENPYLQDVLLGLSLIHI